MPLTLTEKLDSRKWNTGDNASVEMVYILTGTSDDLPLTCGGRYASCRRTRRGEAVPHVKGLTAKTLIENSTATTYNGQPQPHEHQRRRDHRLQQEGLGVHVGPVRRQ